MSCRRATEASSTDLPASVMEGLSNGDVISLRELLARLAAADAEPVEKSGPSGWGRLLTRGGVSSIRFE